MHLYFPLHCHLKYFQPLSSISFQMQVFFTNSLQCSVTFGHGYGISSGFTSSIMCWGNNVEKGLVRLFVPSCDKKLAV
jgi:hypothetical protein